MKEEFGDSRPRTIVALIERRWSVPVGGDDETVVDLTMVYRWDVGMGRLEWHHGRCREVRLV